MSLLPITTERQKQTKRSDAKRVFGALEHLCASSQPGSRLPRHTELMEHLNASERSVLGALGELQRAGRIVRRPRAGTFVAEPQHPSGVAIAPADLADSRTIVVIAKLDHSFFSRCLDLLSRKADSNNLSVICRIIGTDSEPRFLAPTGQSGPLGYILFQHDLAPMAKSLLAQGHRAVIIGGPATDGPQEVTYIHGDHEQGAYLATQHLLELGHRRIAFAMVAENADQSIRWQGQEVAIRDARAGGRDAVGSILTHATVDTWRQNPAAARDYFRQSDAPTGLVVWNDHESVELLTVLLSAGIRVPADVSLVGYDNLPEGSQVTPQLTTIDQNIDQQLRLALRLITQSERPQTAQTVLVTPTLVVRESTAPPSTSYYMEKNK